VLAQLGAPDMRTPIAHALAWPQRIESGAERLNLAQEGDLSFRQPDLERFPCLGLAFEAMRAGENAPVMLNAANEVAVEAFLEERITFNAIPSLVGEVMQNLEASGIYDLNDILRQDKLARTRALELVKQIS
jgi:1-deoxy-D-xylulose-5-phosphate reductoisomerase